MDEKEKVMRRPRLRDADGTMFDPETGKRKYNLGPCSTFCIDGELIGGGACPECNEYEFSAECVEKAYAEDKDDA